jgi:hypothetical protein
MTTIGRQYRGKKEYLLVCCTLVQTTQDRRLVYYGEVASLTGVPASGHHMARQVGQVLDEVSEDEHQARRPMLRAIAVNEAGFPGDGFFKLARQLGKITEGDSEPAFLAAEQQRVYDTWAPDDRRVR